MYTFVEVIWRMYVYICRSDLESVKYFYNRILLQRGVFKL